MTHTFNVMVVILALPLICKFVKGTHLEEVKLSSTVYKSEVYHYLDTALDILCTYCPIHELKLRAGACLFSQNLHLLLTKSTKQVLEATDAMVLNDLMIAGDSSFDGVWKKIVDCLKEDSGIGSFLPSSTVYRDKQAVKISKKDAFFLMEAKRVDLLPESITLHDQKHSMAKFILKGEQIRTSRLSLGSPFIVVYMRQDLGCDQGIDLPEYKHRDSFSEVATDKKENLKELMSTFVTASSPKVILFVFLIIILVRFLSEALFELHR